MTSLEFYEKYCVIKNSDRSTSKPTIRDHDRIFFEIYDVADELNVEPFIRNYARLSKPRFITNPIVQREIEKRNTKSDNP